MAKMCSKEKIVCQILEEENVNTFMACFLSHDLLFSQMELTLKMCVIKPKQVNAPSTTT